MSQSTGTSDPQKDDQLGTEMREGLSSHFRDDRPADPHARGQCPAYSISGGSVATRGAEVAAGQPAALGAGGEHSLRAVRAVRAALRYHYALGRKEGKAQSSVCLRRQSFHGKTPRHKNMLTKASLI